MERESARVDHALIALATAVDEAQVRALFGQLSGDTVIALFSRWAHYTQAWQSLLNQRDPRHWLPPVDQADLLWGRRARFVRGALSVLVAEVFLPKLWAALSARSENNCCTRVCSNHSIA